MTNPNIIPSGENAVIKLSNQSGWLGYRSYCKFRCICCVFEFATNFMLRFLMLFQPAWLFKLHLLLFWTILLYLKGLHWGLVVWLTKKYFFPKNYIFFLPTYLVYQNLCWGTLICPLLNWQLGLKLECICWTGKSV